MNYTSDVYGTDGDDVFDNRINPHFNTFGGLGNDTYFTEEFANFSGGPGNDSLTGGSNGSTAIYWDSPKAVYVDLAAGYADDGWGTRDTLIKVSWVQGSSFGDTLLGNDSSNVFWPGGGSNNTIDGRGGVDKLTLVVRPEDVKWSRTGTTWQYEFGGQGSSPLTSGTIYNVEYVNFFHDGVFSPDFRLRNSEVTPTLPVLDAANPKLDTELIPPSIWKIEQFGIASRSMTETYGPFIYADNTGKNTTYGGGTYTPDPSNAAIGDFNGDGKQDIWITWGTFPDTVASVQLAPTLLLNTGGRLEPLPASQMPTSLSRYFAYRTLAADFTGDGVSDVAFGSMGRMNSQLPPNDSPSSAQPNGLATLNGGTVIDMSSKLDGQAAEGSSFIFAHDSSAGDLNADGRADFYAGGRLWVSTPTGSWSLVTDQLPAALPRAQPMSSAIGDLNGDGRGDLVVSLVPGTWPDSPGESYAMLSSAGSFPNYTVVKLPPLYFGDNSKANALVIGDLNADGLGDIIIANTRRNPYYEGQAVQILMQTRPGVFEDQTASRIDNSPNDKDGGEGMLYLVDANGDGLIDILHGVGGNGANIFLNQGDGKFKAMTLNASDFPQDWHIEGGQNNANSDNPQIRSLYPIDINSDGLYDFVGHTYVSASSPVKVNVATLFTAISSESIWGRDKAETLRGTAMGDVVHGYSGDDTISGLGANDTVDGGTGADTALYSGKITDYFIKYNRALGTATITDHRANADGTDSLKSIEKLQFADKTFDLLNPARTESAAFGKSQSFLFDPAYYLLKHPDLVPTVTLATAFDSYKTTSAQGAAPNAWFDPVYYANKWADLKALNLDAATLFAHYNLYGVWEGRSAGPTFDKYDGTRYLKDNPDVAAYVDAYVADFLGSRSNGAIAHYVIYGAAEGRVAYDTSGVAIEQAILIGVPG